MSTNVNLLQLYFQNIFTKMSLGKRINELRKLKNYSQEVVAEHLDVTKQSISKYENNKALPDWDNLQKIAILLNGDIEELKKLWLTKVDSGVVTDTRSIKEALADVSTKLYIEQEKNKVLRKEIERLKKEVINLQGTKGTGTK